MTPDELIHRYPRVYHMAAHGSWPRIRAHGLRTTTQLVEACAIDADQRATLLDQPRPVSYELDHPELGTITIRDQKPLKLHNLRLKDVDLGGFLNLLNTHVFLWTDLVRLTGLLQARAYRDLEHDVLTLDTASLVASYGDQIRLTTLNTGSTIFPNAPERGPASFMRIAHLPSGGTGKSKTPTVVEFCVLGGIDQIEDHVLMAERRQGARVVETLYARA